jgi:hypothetical protein
VLVVVFVSLVRTVGEWIVGRPLGVQSMDVLPTSLVVGFAQGLAFYALCFFLFSAWLAVILRRRLDQTGGVASVGLLAGVFPPLLDGVIAPGHEISYGFSVPGDWLFTSEAVPPGEAIVLWVVIVSIGLFVWVVRRSALDGLLALAGAWVLMQFIMVFEVAALECLLADTGRPVQRVVYLGVTFGVFVLLRARALLPSLVRINHALPLGAISLAGALWVGHGWPAALALAALMTTSMWIVVVQNDWYDREQDRRGGRRVGVERNDCTWMWFFYLAGVLTVMAWSQVAGWLLALYLAAATLYHLPGVRLKRVFCVSYKIEGVWGATAFLLGARGAPGAYGSPIDGWILWPVLLAFAGQSLVSGLKDYKDVEADAAARVYTWYTLARRRGRNVESVHRWLAGACFAALLSAPLLLGAVAGFHPWLAIACVLAAASAACVLLVRDRRRAVEALFWVLTAYLLALALGMGVVSPLEPVGAHEPSHVIHVTDDGTGPVF